MQKVGIAIEKIVKILVILTNYTKKLKIFTQAKYLLKNESI